MPYDLATGLPVDLGRSRMQRNQQFIVLGIVGILVLAGVALLYNFTGSSQLFPVHAHGKFGYIDRSGKFIINPQFEGAGRYSEGLAPVMTGGKWGYIDKQSKTVIAPQFEQASSYSEDRAHVKMGGRFGYIDKSGRLVINPQFD